MSEADAIHADSRPDPWYVLVTQRHREPVVERFLTQQGMRTYLPRIETPARALRGRGVLPMFPGYLFMQPKSGEGFSRAASTPGVKHFIALEGHPTPLPAGVVQQLRTYEDPDGVIRPPSRPIEGAVEIIEGPFRGLMAVVDSRLAARERVRVLLEFLHRQTAVELPREWVRPA